MSWVRGSSARPARDADGPCRVELRGVHLSYPSAPYLRFTLKEALISLAHFRAPKSLLADIHALRGIDLTVSDGERLGIIGPNGSGKSTLLKAIAGIYPLAAGTVFVAGEIRSLFDILLGFEMEATGRENILYRGLLMGESPAAVYARQDEIAAFADIGEFIGYPVKAYSAGMLIRLAFAISTAFHNDILLLDEIIGAGDAAFLQKAAARIEDMVSRARIMLLVSHDMAAIERMCTRAICLREGLVVDDGPPGPVVKAYRRSVAGA